MRRHPASAPRSTEYSIVSSPSISVVLNEFSTLRDNAQRLPRKLVAVSEPQQKNLREAHGRPAPCGPAGSTARFPQQPRQ
jgi:hypothetical protein